MYFEESKHFRPILNMQGTSGKRNYCEFCNRGYDETHECNSRCNRCFASPPCVGRGQLTCETCHRTFRDAICLENHKRTVPFVSVHRTVCQVVQFCLDCDKVKRTDARNRHKCGHIFCKICMNNKPVNHRCYTRVAANTVASTENVLSVFYDLETRLEPKTESCTSHVPNLCVVQQACRTCLDR